MQSRAFQDNQEYILPARFDDTEIPGVLPTTGYISLREKTPIDLVSLIHRKLIQSGRTIPSERVRSAVYSVEALPRQSPVDATVLVVDENGAPVQGADIVAIADNNTRIQSISSDLGLARLSIHTRRSYRLLIAHPSMRAAVVEKWDTADDIRVTLMSSENTGALICRGTGYIPGLEGRLNPILDASDRRYLYADHMAIRGGEIQPAKFDIGVSFSVEDALGTVMQVTVLHIQGDTSLLEFTHARSPSA